MKQNRQFQVDLQNMLKSGEVDRLGEVMVELGETIIPAAIYVGLMERRDLSILLSILMSDKDQTPKQIAESAEQTLINALREMSKKVTGKISSQEIKNRVNEIALDLMNNESEGN